MLAVIIITASMSSYLPFKYHVSIASLSNGFKLSGINLGIILFVKMFAEVAIIL